MPGDAGTPEELLGLIDAISTDCPDASIQSVCFAITKLIAGSENQLGRERVRELLMLTATLWKKAKALGESEIEVHHVHGGTH